jgi:CSLREA domain-containing protein
MTARWVRATATAISALAVLFSCSFRLTEAESPSVASQKQAPLAVFTVNSTGDEADLSTADGLCLTTSGNCTLRAAIQQANATAGADTIDFSLGAGTPSISPVTALPSITDQVTINGNTGGATRVQISGSSIAAANTHGLVLAAGSNGSTIKSLIIRQWTGNGIRILSNNNFIEDNYVGTDQTGNAAAANSTGGVVINLASGNTVGGATSAQRNVISGNTGDGVAISNTTTANTVAGNYIGIGANGTTDVGNTLNGVSIGLASNQLIGGSTATPGTAPGNVISGNGSDGVEINATGGAASNNNVQGNLIGTNAVGTTGVKNDGNGLFITGGASSNTIGGSSSMLRNVISANTTAGGDGIEINTGSSNTVAGNYIGTDINGTADLGNVAKGVFIIDSSGNTIGGSSAAARNIISGNNGSGIEIDGDASDNNTVAGNYIGTDVNGTADLGNTANGVLITTSADNNTVGGLTATPGTAPGNVIGGNGGDGIEINGSTTTPNKVQGNLIGLQAGGTSALRNEGNGVAIVSSPSNTIGGSDAMARNIISGHAQATDDDGVDINGESADSNIVAGNYIGTNINGTIAIANGGDGVLVQGGADSNTIGGSTATPGTAPGNVLSGNTGDGVEIIGGSAASNKVQGNLIGLQAGGAAAVANGSRGVYLVSAISTTIGGATSDFRNIISGNGGSGIRMEEGSLGNPDNNMVQSNYIGTDITGLVDLGNTSDGVILSQADSCTIGGTTTTPGTAPGNLISGNNLHGVEMESDASSNDVLGNLIGTKINGTEALPNSSDGARIEGGASSNIIGGTASGSRNIISGNSSDGVEIFNNNTGNTTANLIQGNYIGTTVGGNAALGNAQMGVRIGGLGVLSNTVGGTAAGASNVISGNVSHGINLDDTNTNTVQGNLIGTNAAATSGIPNGGAGVHVSGTGGGHTIGGTAAGASNTIAFNTGDGVWIEATTANSIRGNSIHSNTGLGIDLTGGTENAAGVTANDSGDGDTGANNLQNFPVITSATVGGGTTTVGGTLNSTPSTTFAIDFYSNTTPDPSGNGEGTTYRGSTSVTTDGSGNATFSGVVLTTTDPLVTATATNTTGSPASNTSEFAANFSPLSPTAAELESFKALSDESGKVYLEWQTGYEADNLGFNLYRESAGKRARVNRSLIAGSALLAGQHTILTAGNSYAWFDREAADEKSVTYWLEDIDLNGKTTLHGPFIISKVDKLPSQPEAILLDNISKDSDQSAKDRDQSAKDRDQSAARPVSSSRLVTGLDRTTSVFAQSANNLQTQWMVAAKAAVKIMVRRDGWYRVSQSELVAAGLDPSRDPNFLQMFVDGQEVPIRVNSGQKGTLAPTDSIEFYATGLDTSFTDLHTYYLIAGTEPGRRIEGFPAEAKSAGIESFSFTVERRDRIVFFAALKNGEADNWFGPPVGSTVVNQTISIRHFDTASPTSPFIEVAIQGATDLAGPADHNVTLKLNGSHIATISFDGQAHHTDQFTIPAGLLQEGANTVSLQALGGQSDVSVLDYIRLTYQHTFLADDDSLVFTASSGEAVTVTGFTTPNIRVFDITDLAGVKQLMGVIKSSKSDHSVTVAGVGAGERTLIAISDNAINSAPQVTANQPSSWNKPSQGADLVIISHRSLAASLGPLKSLRNTQGYAVTIIDVEDLYDEFSYGARSPWAIRDFLTHARISWKRPPRFALFAGDSSFDPRNYLGYGDYDFVPTKLLAAGTMETASDDWLADSNSDGVPELAVGRLPARTAEQMSVMVSKIVSYEQNNRSAGALMVTDRNDGFDFEAASRRVKALLPAEMTVREVLRSRVDDATAKKQILEGIAMGPKIVNYLGHGSVGLWRGNLLTTSDTANLTNRDRLSVVITMTCLNGTFHDPVVDGLAESLLKAEQGGAVAAWGSSALTGPAAQAQMNEQVIRELLYGRSSSGLPLTIGEATMRAKAAVADLDVRRSWILFGDPMTKLK